MEAETWGALGVFPLLFKWEKRGSRHHGKCYSEKPMVWHKASLETAAKDFEFHFEMLMSPIFHSLKARQAHAYPGLLWRRPSLSSGQLLCMPRQVRPGGLAVGFIESWVPEGAWPLLFRKVER